MGSLLLSHINAAERGESLGAGFAVDRQALCFLERFDLRAGRTEEVSVLRVESGEAVCNEELFELADVFANAAVLEHAGEYEASLALGDFRFRPEGGSAERVPAVGIDAALDDADVTAFRLDHVEVGIDDVTDVSGAARGIDLEHEVAHAELVLRELAALVIETVRGEVIFQNTGYVLKPEHAETTAVKSTEHVAVARLDLLPPVCDRAVRVCLGSLPAADPSLCDLGRGLSLSAPDIYGMVVHLLLQAGNKVLKIILLQHYRHPPFRFR